MPVLLRCSSILPKSMTASTVRAAISDHALFKLTKIIHTKKRSLSCVMFCRSA